MDTFPSIRQLTVVNLGHGMAAAVIANHCATAGSMVYWPAGPDPTGIAARYPSYGYWRSRCLELPDAEREEIVARADVVIVGGEDEPGLTHVAAPTHAGIHPGQVVVDLGGYLSGEAAGPAIDLLVQARTGMSMEQYASRPINFAVPFPTYGQILTALVGMWAALVERLDSGCGQIVRATLQQGSAFFMAPFWMSATTPDGDFDKVAPKDSNHLVFRCSDGLYVQLVLGVPSAVKKLYTALKIDQEVDPNDRGLPKAGATAGNYFGDAALIGTHVAAMTREQVIAASQRQGIPVAPVLAPGEFWDHDQVVQCGLLSDADGFTMSGAPVHVDRILNVSGAPTLEFLDPTRSRPLAGLRFLDLGAYVAGPFASRLLGDLGAEVIKIEPRQGDPLRGIPRTFILTNAGKKSVIADLKTDQGRQQIHTLVRGADVVHHNYRAGVAERLGVGPQDLRAINPDIITVTTSAFGPSGPMAADPGFDMVIQALTGIEVRAGGNGNTPLWCRMPFVDFVSGALAAAGTLMALYERRNRGTASDISTSLLDAGMFMMSDLVRLQDGTFVMSRELDHQQLGTHPAERIYRATDGWLAVAVRSNHMAAELLEELGLAGEHDSNYPSWGEHVNEALAKRISQRECDELATALQRRDVWAQRCIQDGWAVLQRSEPAQRAGLVVVRTHRRYGEVAGIIGGFVEFSRVGTETAALGAVPELGQSAAWSTRPVVRSMTDVGQQRRTEREVEECQT